MFDLMFAAALSGMRAAEAAEQSQPEPIQFNLVPESPTRKTSEKDWRELVRQDFELEEQSECPIFFQKEVTGFGVLRVTPLCSQEIPE